MKGGERPLAFTKEEKKALVTTYEQWLKDHQAVFVLSFKGMSMKDVNTLRAEARQAGGEVHIVKNTLMNLAIQNIGLENPGWFDGASLISFTQEDAASLAKAINTIRRTGEIFTIKGGYFAGKVLDASQVVALAELPPMPVVRAKLVGLIQTPMTQLVRTLSEPARRVAAVLKNHSEKSAEATAG
jgi:large subunit ribosomal protein L10